MKQLPPEVWKAIRTFIRPYALGSFTVLGEPARKQRPKFRRAEDGTVVTYTPSETVKAEKHVAEIFAEALPGWQPEPDETWGALVEIHTKSAATTDLDNIAKLVLDALNKRAWADDVQVGDLFIHLDRGASEPRVEVVVFQCAHNGTRRTSICECGTRYRAASPRCHACTKKRTAARKDAQPALAGVDALLGADPAAVVDYGVLRRKVFNQIAVTLAAGKQPTPAGIARTLSVESSHIDMTISQLIAGGWITRSGRTYTVIRSLGEAA